MNALRRAGMVLLGLVLLGGLWELYKDTAPSDGVSFGSVPILPRTGDASMPHLSSIWHAFGSQEVSLAGSSSVLGSIASAGFYTLKLALGGFVVGLVIGVLLAVLMDRLRFAERGLLPWIVLSQTVPLIAIAPLISGWGAGVHFGGFQWEQWMSVAVIAAYLSFFPISVGMLRGLKSPTAVHVELFRSLSAGWFATLIRLELPAAVPFLIPALRLGAAASVVGAVVAETSIGVPDGIGRVIIDYSQQATGDPSRLYAAVIGAALLGLVAAALVSLLDLGLRSYQRGRTA
ncbi:NitT/TauT family transport system permease protein [Nakamurella sp. UYEF19]|uniref:ABC transporter permease n=1 Tax=Nakamurella sp. UYEF19 TaxID=1756392 RepID=UPI00339A3382